jgi:hypothetical protein
MEKPQIKWRPSTLATADALIAAMLFYASDRGNFRIYENGTVVFIKAENDNDANAHRCLDELAFIPDFRVVPMKNGNYMVSPHSIGAALILADEFHKQLDDLKAHHAEAIYPGEAFFQGDENFPIGLVGRAKIYRDALEKKQIYHHKINASH